MCQIQLSKSLIAGWWTDFPQSSYPLCFIELVGSSRAGALHIMSNFKLICSTKASDVVPVNKYVSEKTGLTVIIAETEGPLVNGFFCLGKTVYLLLLR